MSKPSKMSARFGSTYTGRPRALSRMLATTARVRLSLNALRVAADLSHRQVEIFAVAMHPDLDKRQVK